MKHSFWKNLSRKSMALAIAATMFCPAQAAFAAGDVRIYINNEYLQGSELAYVNAKGYTMVPMRAISEALNAEVLYNSETKTITCIRYDEDYRGERIVTFVIGGKSAGVNGAVIPLSCAVEVKNGRTLLPFRDTATLLGITDIEWDAATRSAYLWTDASYHYEDDKDSDYYEDDSDDSYYYDDEDSDDSYYYDEDDFDDSNYYDEDEDFDDSYYYDENEDFDDSYYYDDEDESDFDDWYSGDTYFDNSWYSD